MEDCLALNDPLQRQALARDLLSAGNTHLIAGSANSELIGLACQVAMELSVPQERGAVVAQLLVVPARLAMEGAHEDDLRWALIAAHSVHPEAEVAPVVEGLLATHAPCERLARVAAAYADQLRGGDPTLHSLRQCLSVPICRALARSNSFLAIGQAAHAIGALPLAEREAAVASLLSPGACAAVGMSANVGAVTQALRATGDLPPDARVSACEALLTARACAAVARSGDPDAVSRAAMAAVALSPGRRHEVLENLLTLPACDHIAEHGDAGAIAGAAMAATVLPAGARRDGVLERLLDAGACAHVEETGDLRAMAETAYAATFLTGQAKDTALGHLIADDFCTLVRGTQDPSCASMAFFAASHLEDPGERNGRLTRLMSGHAVAAVAALGSDVDVRLTQFALEVMPEGDPVKAAALQQLGLRNAAAAPSPPHWSDITTRPAGLPAGAGCAPSPRPGPGPGPGPGA